MSNQKRTLNGEVLEEDAWSDAPPPIPPLDPVACRQSCNQKSYSDHNENSQVHELLQAKNNVEMYISRHFQSNENDFFELHPLVDMATKLKISVECVFIPQTSMEVKPSIKYLIEYISGGDWTNLATI